MTKFESLWTGEEYERIGGLGDKAKNAVVTRILNNLSRERIRSLIGKSKGETAKELLIHPGQYQLFNAIYNADTEHPVDGLDKVLNSTVAARAVRNRFRFLQKAHYEMGREAAARNGSAVFFGIGVGDANAEIRAMRRLADEGHVSYLVALDRDSQSVEDGYRRAHEHGLEHRVIFIEAEPDLQAPFSMRPYLDEASSRAGQALRPDIAVNIGLNQYLDLHPDVKEYVEKLSELRKTDAQVPDISSLGPKPTGRKPVSRTEISNLLKGYRQGLSPNGRIVAENTGPHDRVPFLENGLDWFCVYRDLGELRGLVQEAGFGIEYAGQDPTGNTNIVIGRKGEGQ